MRKPRPGAPSQPESCEARACSELEGRPKYPRPEVVASWEYHHRRPRAVVTRERADELPVKRCEE